jgi:hypothetical protein
VAVTSTIGPENVWSYLGSLLELSAWLDFSRLASSCAQAPVANKAPATISKVAKWSRTLES